jgi:hypothetical protein
MYVTMIHLCKFAIFTEVDSFYETIQYDQHFFEKEILPKLA